MNWFEALWNFLNGNKTKLGALILSIAAILPDGIIVLDIVDLKVALLWLGGTLGGVGVAHMMKKSTTDPGPNA